MSSRFLAPLCGILAIAVGFATIASAQAQKEKKLKPGIYAHFETTLGNFTVKFFDKEAPKTVANFVGLAEGTIDPITGKPGKSKPFYDGLTFHRIIGPAEHPPDGFMIQGGDPQGTGMGGPGYKIPDELNPGLRFDRPGIMAMANTGQPNTGGSQFFITLARYEGTTYTIFGEVVDGMDVVVKIGNVKTGANSRPVTPVIMKKVTIERVPVS
jgi:peptidyl-prolyl cis-trans isomerase A (cyclophilin A)